MNTENGKTLSQLANEAKQTGGDAVESAQGYAQGVEEAGKDPVQSIRSYAEDVKQNGQETIDTAQGYANEAKDRAKSAADTGRAYARDAVDATGKRMGDFKDQVAQVKEQGVQYVIEQPVRSVLFAAVGAAALTALLLSVVRGGRR